MRGAVTAACASMLHCGAYRDPAPGSASKPGDASLPRVSRREAWCDVLLPHASSPPPLFDAFQSAGTPYAREDGMQCGLLSLPDDYRDMQGLYVLGRRYGEEPVGMGIRAPEERKEPRSCMERRSARVLCLPC
jgi:hypothetical protein